MAPPKGPALGLVASAGCLIVKPEPKSETPARGGATVSLSQKAAETLVQGETVVFAQDAGLPILYAGVEYLSLTVEEVRAVLRKE